MSVLIKGMEMPVGCWWRDSLGLYRECPFFDRDCYCYKLNREVSDNCAKRPFDCPLVEVPTPHGRLKPMTEPAIPEVELTWRGDGWELFGEIETLIKRRKELGAIEWDANSSQSRNALTEIHRIDGLIVDKVLQLYDIWQFGHKLCEDWLDGFPNWRGK